MDLSNFCWRKINGEYITGLKDLVDSTFEDRYLTLPVDQLTKIIYEEVQKYPMAEVYWRHEFVGFTQDATSVTVSTKHNGEVKNFTADFLIGCDGGRSGVRRALFGRVFPGFTWDVQVVATNVPNSPTPAMKAANTDD